jgi:hypothetical protein
LGAYYSGVVILIGVCLECSYLAQRPDRIAGSYVVLGLGFAWFELAEEKSSFKQHDRSLLWLSRMFAALHPSQTAVLMGFELIDWSEVPQLHVSGSLRNFL